MIDSPMGQDISHCEKSDIGFERHNNEDYFLIVDRSGPLYDLTLRGMLFVIADGMGGHAAGEIASRMACEETVSAYYGDTESSGGPEGDGPVALLEKSIWAAHHAIIRAAGRRDDWRGMGTTLSALALLGDKALIAHVGDSRIYRWRDGGCRRLTVDHTKNQALVDAGLIPPGEESTLYGSHILTQALGGYGDLNEVFTRVETVSAGDRFLMCTDGLHGFVTDEEIRAVMAENPAAPAACDALVQAAMDRGGQDNVTVIVIQL